MSRSFFFFTVRPSQFSCSFLSLVCFLSLIIAVHHLHCSFSPAFSFSACMFSFSSVPFALAFSGLVRVFVSGSRRHTRHRRRFRRHSCARCHISHRRMLLLLMPPLFLLFLPPLLFLFNAPSGTSTVFLTICNSGTTC